MVLRAYVPKPELNLNLFKPCGLMSMNGLWFQPKSENPTLSVDRVSFLSCVMMAAPVPIETASAITRSHISRGGRRLLFVEFIYIRQRKRSQQAIKVS